MKPLPLILSLICLAASVIPNTSAAAQGPVDSAQKAIDDECFKQYGRANSACNYAYDGDDSEGIDACIGFAKFNLNKCCVKNGGSPSCVVDDK